MHLRTPPTAIASPPEGPIDTFPCSEYPDHTERAFADPAKDLSRSKGAEQVPRSAPLRLGRAVQEHALFAPDPLPMDRLDTRTAERAEPDTAGQPGRADAQNDHDSRVIAHYQACGEDFYLQDHHDEHIHFGYWGAADAAAACERMDRSALPAALHRLIEVVAAPAGIQANHFVVDAGCGVGGTARFLAREYGCNVLGLDCTPGQIALAKQKTAPTPTGETARIEYRVADVTKPWAVDPGSVDVVVNIENACYYQRRREFLAEVTSALRPGGHLAMNDWMRVEPMTAAEYVQHINPVCQHWTLWSLESLESYKRLIEKAGLDVVELEDLGQHVLPMAHQLLREADKYDAAGKTSYAVWTRVLGEAWVARKFTIGRILARKPVRAATRSERTDKQNDGTPSEQGSGPMLDTSHTVRTRYLHDFGRMIAGLPAAVARPRTLADVPAIVHEARRANLGVVVHGAGHSQNGQSLAEAAVLLDLIGLDRVHPPHGGTLQCEAGARWHQVLDALDGTGLLPPVLPDSATITVGGTVAAGGIGTTSHRYGAIAENVNALEVVTSEGDRVKCSESDNRELFDAVRGGQGQFGPIIQIWLSLRQAAPRLRVYKLAYTDADRFLRDFDAVSTSTVFDHVRAEQRPDTGTIILHAALEHEDEPNDDEILEHLHPNELLSSTDSDDPSRAGFWPHGTFDNRDYHPWRDWLVPWSELANVVRGTPSALNPPHLSAPRWFYPLGHGPIPAPFLMRPDGERSFGYGILARHETPDGAKRTARELAETDEALTSIGAVAYLSGNTGYDQARWRSHYGLHFDLLAALKRRFDPDTVFGAKGLPFAHRPARDTDTPGLPSLTWSVRRNGRLVAESDPSKTDTDAILRSLESFQALDGDVFVVSSLAWQPPPERSEYDEHLGAEGHGNTALAFITENRTEIVAPEHTIARNQPFPAALHRFLAKGIGAHSFELRFATTATKLVRIGNPPVEAPLCRGASLVPTEPEPGENRPLALAGGIASWMTANMDSDGRLPYLWHTSEERPSILEDNAIRRFLGAGALGRFAVWQGDPSLLDAYRRHLTRLLGDHLEPLGEGLAVIADADHANLGAASIAGLAILAGPAADRDRRALGMLLAAVRASTDEFQGFRTYFYPADRNPMGWEFFSGEALLFLAEAKRLKVDDAPDVEELLVLYRRCRDRWHESRHVAFVSWHSQALASLYRLQPLAEIAEFVFELNDWLLPLQRTDPAEPERVGEFGDELRPHHGTPHASSTGVYLEGLADARDLARAIGDEARTRQYTTAIDLGLRSLRQLQLRDWRCTWYLSRPEAVLGALRCNVDNNQIRIDNCGHALAAAVKLLEPMSFPAPGTQG